MRPYFFLLIAFVCCFVTGCDDDDTPTNPVAYLGRFEGWYLAEIESDLASELSTAILAIPDSTLERYDTSRQALLDAAEATVAAKVGLDPCEQDDVVFFNEGVLAYGEVGEACPAGAAPSVLLPFNNKSYATDLDVTDLTVTDPTTQQSSVYRVELLTESQLVIGQLRRVPEDLPVPGYQYTITYRFVAR